MRDGVAGVVLGLAVLGSLVVGITAAAKSDAPPLRAVPAQAAPSRGAGRGGAVSIDLCAKTNARLGHGPGERPDLGLRARRRHAAAPTAQLPGPVLGIDTPTITAGDTVTINLTNVDVPENVSVVIPGLDERRPARYRRRGRRRQRVVHVHGERPGHVPLRERRAVRCGAGRASDGAVRRARRPVDDVRPSL